MVDAAIGLGCLDPKAQGVEIVEVVEHRLHVDQLALQIIQQRFPGFHRGEYYRPHRGVWAIQ